MKEKNSRRKCERSNESKKRVRGDGAQMFSQTDPYGMYTGAPRDKNDRPVQDADDL